MKRAILVICPMLMGIGCGEGAAVSGEFAAACEQGCSEYLESPDDADVCADQAEQCQAACVEVTTGSSGACSACLTSDGLEGPEVGDDGCLPAYFDPEYCVDAC